MHVGSRTMENVLHIGYKRDLRKWYITETENKETVKNIEQKIRNKDAETLIAA